MKALNVSFGILGLLFISLGLALLLSQAPNEHTQDFFFFSSFCGLVCMTFFIITDKAIKSQNH